MWFDLSLQATPPSHPPPCLPCVTVGFCRTSFWTHSELSVSPLHRILENLLRGLWVQTVLLLPRLLFVLLVLEVPEGPRHPAAPEGPADPEDLEIPADHNRTSKFWTRGQIEPGRTEQTGSSRINNHSEPDETRSDRDPGPIKPERRICSCSGENH